MSYQNSILGFFFAYLLLAFIVAWGWALNVFDLVTGYATMTTNELILRGIGVFLAPLGAFFGWF